MKTMISRLIVLWVTLMISAIGFAQDAAIDTTFNPTDVGFGDGANNTVETTAIQSDGKIIIGGAFNRYNGAVMNHIARINADGRLDSTFNLGVGADNAIEPIVIQGDGKIIIGGSFTAYNGIARNRIARINIDGSLDTTFNPGTGANNGVTSCAIQSDGKIIVGGYFTSYNGTSTNHIARINVDGTLDSTFNSGTGASNYIYSIAIQSDGRIIIGGTFTSYNGTIINRIARINLDGTIDTTFNPGSGANSDVSKIAIQGDGKIIVGGGFTNYNGTVINYIARINADGTLDSAFNTSTPMNYILAVAIQGDGKIIIGFYLGSSGGITRVNADGSADSSFLGSGTNGSVSSATIQADGRIIIGGYFTSYNGTPKYNIARINTDGTSDSTFDIETGSNGTIYTSAIQADGKIIIGGLFTKYNGTAINHIARLNSNGTIDSTFNVGAGTNSAVYATAVQADGKIIICGGFSMYNGVSRNGISRLNADGILDTTFNPGTGAIFVGTSAIQSDGKIIIGGGFTTYNGSSINCIARINANGTLDTSFNPGTGANSGVLSIAIQGDGKIVIGGGFTIYNGTPRNRIVRLNSDGTLDLSFNIGYGANNSVLALAIQGDGRIIIGGRFTKYNSITRNYIARLNADGTLDASWLSFGGSAQVRAVAIKGDGKIIIGGDFYNYNGTPRYHIARINPDGTSDLSFNPALGSDKKIYTLAIQSDGKIVIGGEFTSYYGIGKNRVARVLDACTSPTITSEPANTTVCENQNAAFSIVASDASIYQWEENQGSGFVALSNGGVYSNVSTSTLNITGATASMNGYTYRCLVTGGCSLNATSTTKTLNVINNSYYTITQIACDSFLLNAQTYTASGTYTQNFSNAEGCDSILTLNLTINSIDNSVTQSSNLLTANATGATYQWLDCDSGFSPISGSTNQTCTATASGNYAVLIDISGCSDTSACYNVSATAINNYFSNSGITIFPNPANEKLIVTLDNFSTGTITIYNTLGEIVLYKQLNSKISEININSFGNGIYFVKVISKENSYTEKIVKK